MATSVSKTVEALASANEWVNSTVVTPFALDEVITVSTTASDANTGKYYTAGNQIRLYQTGAATMTLTAAEGYTISSVKLTYASQNTGILVEAGSGTAVPFENVQSATFTVGNSGTATNGQVRLTAFEVEYAATGGTTTTKTIYCKCAQSWWKADGAAVAVYAWTGDVKNAAWPGVRMEAVTGEEGIWKADIDTAKYAKIIFTRVNATGDIADWGAKTADLTIPADKDLYTITSTSAVWGDPGVAGAWSVYGGEVTPVDPPTPVDSMTVFFVNVPEWTAVNAFVWPAEGDAYKAWPGEAMTPVNTEINGKAVYAYTFPENYVNIIFNNGEAQTADLVWNAAKPYFYDGAWYELDSIPAPTPVVPVDSMTVYFVNVPEWTAVNAFVWPAEGDAYKVWPGEAMTPVNTEINGKAVYAYTFPENYVNIIFNNGDAQTADLVWNAAKPYFYDGAWYALDEIPTEPIVHETMTVYFVNVPEWETVNAFVWPAEGNAPVAWPGEAMTPVDMEINGKAVFAYTFDAINVNIIFNNGEAQTADLVWNAAKPYFYDGAWYALDEIPTPGPTVEDGFYLVGTLNEWTAAAEYKFVANEGAAGEYLLVATLAQGNELKVKKVEAGQADVWYPAEGGNYVVDAAHAGTKTIYFRPEYNAEWAAFGGYMYIPGQGEGVENIDADTKVVKQMINGSLFIIRGEKTYTIQGQLVR